MFLDKSPTRSRSTVFITILIAFATICVGCTSSESQTTVDNEPNNETVETTTDDDSGSDTDDADLTGPAVEENEIVSIQPSDKPSTSAVVSAMGGISFDYPEGTKYVQLDDSVLISSTGNDASESGIGVALVTQFAAGNQISGLEEYLDVLRTTHEVSPTGTSIQLGEWELKGYEMTGSERPLPFAASRFPAQSPAANGPDLYARIYAAETPSGILTAGIGGDDNQSAETMLPAFGTLLASLEFVGPGLDPALPPGEIIEPENAGPPPPAAENEDAVLPPLGAPFTAVETPGRYELINFGLPVSVDFPEGWFVQPNFPGTIVLTHPDSSGPNDRDIVFLNSLAELVPLAGGPIRAGEAIDFSDIDAFIQAPPDGLETSEVERFELEAPDGTSMPVITFSLEVEERACTVDDPCDYGFVTTYGFVKTLRASDAIRLWWFPEHPHGPAAAIAVDTKPTEWISEAVTLMDTLELGR